MIAFAPWSVHFLLAATILGHVAACGDASSAEPETQVETRDTVDVEPTEETRETEAAPLDSEADAIDAVDDSEAASNDNDDDGVANAVDACANGNSGWTSDPSNDLDADGCRDADEDDDDDNDGVADTSDQCPRESALGADEDGDGCPDIVDEDGDRVADDVDVCPGFYDPEQIDVEAPFGQGDVCSPECTTLERIEIPGPHELDDIGRTVLPYGLQPPHAVRYWYKYDGACGTFSDAYSICIDCSEHRFTHGFSSPATVVIRQDFDDGRCVVRVARSAAPPDAWMRIEISAFSEDGDCPDGAELLHMLVHPDSEGPDLDGDGLPEPYLSPSFNDPNCVQYMPMESYCSEGWGDVMPLATVSATSDDRSAAFILLRAPYPRISLGVLAKVAKSRIEVRIYHHDTLIQERVATDVPPFTIWDVGVLTTGINRLVPAGVCQLTGRLCSIDADCGEGTCVSRFLSVPPFD